MRLPARRTLTAAVAVLGLVVAGEVLLASTAEAAVGLSVGTTADVAATAGHCGNTTTTPVPNPLSLREAICIANNYGASQAVTITVPAGHYVLSSGELDLGSVSGANVTIAGAGPGADAATDTIIDGNHASRVLNIDAATNGNVAAAISGVTIENGQDDTFGGAGILDGSGYQAAGDVLTLTHDLVTGNQANVANPSQTSSYGGGVAFEGGQLTVSSTTFTNNSSGSSVGGGLYYQGYASAPTGLSITGSSFAGNAEANTSGSSSVTDGGALAVAGLASTAMSVSSTAFLGNTVTTTSGPAVGGAIYQQSGNLTVTGSTFTGNSASTSGGAIEVTTGTTALHYDRFLGNTSPSGGAVHSLPTAAATDNWWGCNAGPGSAGCDTTSGSVTSAPRLVLAAISSPSTVVGPNGTATISASLVTDSAGFAVAGTNLHAFDTLPATFSDPPGDATVTLSGGSHTAAFGTGAGHADIDYHSGTVTGPDPINVTFDNQTVTVSPTVDQPPAITSPNTAHFNIGSAGSFTITTVGYPTAALTESGTLPTGLTFHDNGDGTATISGTPTGGGGTFPLTLTANNGVAPNASQTLTLTVGQPPAFTSGSTAPFVIGQAGSFTVTTSGIPTVSSITEFGTLPTGVTFTDNGNGTATIAGTPTGTGSTYPVVLTATNGVSPNATQNLTIQVNQAPSVTSNPVDQTVQPGTSVSFSASASGVPTPTVQWQQSTDGGGSFANISGATGTTYTFTAALGDNGNQYRAVFSNGVGSPATSTAATLHVGTAPAFTSADHTTFAVGQAGSFTVTTTGLPSATLSRTGAQFPAWLTLTDNGDGTGTLTGTPPAGSAGQYQFMLKAANGFSPTASQTFTLSVDAPPVITSANHATFAFGLAGSFAVTTTAGFPTTTSIIESGSLPVGLSFVDHGDGTATLAGTPNAGTGGVYPITISASASGGITAPATQSFTLTVNEPPTITSTDHATFGAGIASLFTVTTSAGYPAATLITETGALPGGVTFTDNGDGTGFLTGTPNAGTGGVYTVTLTASNGIMPASTQSFTLTVNEPPHITSANHSTFTRGTPGSFTVTTAGGQPSAITLTESGSLPGGLSFSDNGDGTATISGIPTAGGSFPLTIRASNGVAPDATQAFTLTVNQPPSITSAPASTFAVGTAGSFTVTTDAGVPASSTITESGALPGGVTFTDNGDGTATLAGTPATGTDGSYPLTITASNGVAPDATQSFTLTVTAVPVITSADHATFAAGSAGSFTVTTMPGFPAATALSESGALPGGVTFVDNGDGTATLAGTPAAGGSYPITLTATNAAGHTDQAFTLTVTQLPVITSADHATFAAGSAGSFTVTTAAGVPADTALTESGALPSGVSFLDNGDGTATLAGTPAAGGSYPITLTATNAAGHTDQAFTLTVTQLPVITSADHATFGVGSAGSFTVTTAAGFPTATALTEAGALPGGVTFVDNGDGTATLAGTPTAGSGGAYPVTVTATNSAGHADQSFTLFVDESTAITSADHTTFLAGTAGSFTVTTAGGYPTPPSLTASGALPSGVTFVDNGDGTATLAGTPGGATGGSYPLVITATNGRSVDGVQHFTLVVNQTPAITSGVPGTFTVGTGNALLVTTSGYPAPALTESGALPSGVTFVDHGDGTATLGGVPDAGTAGDYAVTIKADNGTGTAAGQQFLLHVVKQAQTITVTSTPPSPALVGGTYPPSATSDSGLAVAYSVDATATTNSACTLVGSTVELQHAGTCAVDYDQAGDGTYAAAPQVQETFTVAANATSVALTSSVNPSVYGQALTATATVSVGSGVPAPDGSVQFAVDGNPVGAAVTVSGGTATSPSLDPLAPGTHTVTAVFTPSDTTTYSGSENTLQQVVNQASTTTALTVGPTSLTAVVAAVAPGAGSPSGTVTFGVGGHTVGSAHVSGGVATLTYKVPTGMTQHVAAMYSGDTDFTMSSASTSRSDPTITATITSAHPRSAYGWYRSPVTVTFHCATHGAALTGPCPAPVVFRYSAAGRSVARTITATDGGAASVVVRVNLDQIAPTVSIGGVRNGASYLGTPPKATCIGRDTLSGIASCRLGVTHRGLVTTVTATATDRAGNVRTARLSYKTVQVSILGAKFERGAYDVKIGRTYTVVAYTSTKPTYFDANVYPKKPTVRDHVFHYAGHGRWTLGVTMQQSLHTHPIWNIGVKIGKTLVVLRIRVS